MPTDKYTLTGKMPLVMTGEAAEKLIASGKGDAALLYLYLIRERCEFSAEAAAKATSMTPARAMAAAQELAAMGLIAKPAAQPLQTAAPEPEKRDLDRVIKQKGQVFPALVDDVERALGKVLSAADTTTLLTVYDSLGLPPEVILLLVAHCCDVCAEKYGPGRKPTMRFIEKEAYIWEREGLFTLDLAEAYLGRAAKAEAGLRRMAAALGMEAGELTDTGRRYILGWLELGFTPEAAAIALDRTVTNTGKRAWKYMDAIFQSWHSKGLHTAAEIERGDSRPGRTQQPKTAAPTGKKTTAAATQAEVERNRRIRELIEKGSS